MTSTCGHCGETVDTNSAAWDGVWLNGNGSAVCSDMTRLHTVDLSHAFSHMSSEG